MSKRSFSFAAAKDQRSEEDIWNAWKEKNRHNITIEETIIVEQLWKDNIIDLVLNPIETKPF